MGLEPLTGDHPGIIATQSTHKQLASFSQASQIHVKDNHLRGQRRRVEHRRFNEIFLLHATTSPFYPLFASLDVGAQMMKGRSGEVLWDDTIRLGIELRKKIRAILGIDAGCRLAWLPACGEGLRHHRSEQIDPADTRL
jgi:ornithine decarboxylase